MANLTLSFFNSFEVSVQEKHISRFRSAKVQGLLVYLVLEAGTVHTRDGLAMLLWPDEPRATARKNLRQSLYQLRQILGQSSSEAEPFLLVTRQTAQFNAASDTVLDVALFQAAVERGDLDLAETYYTGPLLPTFGCDSQPFDDWLSRKRHAYQQAALGALHALAERQLALGKAALSRALALARHQLDLEPWREEAHRQLMRGLALSGDRSGAIAQFDVCSDVLADELGVSPADETFALFEAIRDGRFPPQSETLAAEIPNNIPHQATPLVGRSAEIAHLVTHLHNPNTRLMTIVGPGGMGKTRLSLETARTLLDADGGAPFPSGIFLVELAAATARDEMLAACATAFGFALESEPEPLQQIVNFLSNKQLLLLLDNVEQLIAPPERAAEVVSALLKGALGLKVLVTSRQKLNLTGEHVLPLEGLELTELQPGAPAQTSDAVQLFAQSARRVQPTFQLTDHNAVHVANICRLTAGMPLGILLSAAWSHLLTPAEIAAEMQTDIDFIAGQMPDLPARQRSMRAVFDHSWALLTEKEQDVLAKLSVFQGGFTREAAQAVTGGTLRQLLGLVNKSLVQRNVTNGRFSLHELLRQLAAEKMGANDQFRNVRTSHSRYYLSWLTEQNTNLQKYKFLETLQQLRADIQNIEAAWLWAATTNDTQTLQTTIQALSIYYKVTGLEISAIDLLQQTIRLLPSRDIVVSETVDDSILLRASLLNHLQDHGISEDENGQTTDIDKLHAIFKALGAKLEEAKVCQHIGYRAMRQRKLPQAMAYFRNQMEIYEQEDEVLRLTVVLGGMGMLLLYTGQVDFAYTFGQRSKDLAAKYNNQIIASEGLFVLAFFTLYAKGDLEAGKQQLAELTNVGMKSWLAGLNARVVLGGLGQQAFICIQQGQLNNAQRFLNEMTKIAKSRNSPNSLNVVHGIDSLIEMTKGQYDSADLRILATYPGSVLYIGIIAMALASYGRGDAPSAAKFVVQAWSMPITLRWLGILLQYLPIVASLLADQGHYARAVALLAMGRAHPACPRGWWEIMDLMQKLEARLQAELSPAELAEAQARGRAMDVQATAMALLKELKGDSP
jgi:predicted ATPase/DNA-binding SARP family transcriptional activator